MDKIIDAKLYSNVRKILVLQSLGNLPLIFSSYREGCLVPFPESKMWRAKFDNIRQKSTMTAILLAYLRAQKDAKNLRYLFDSTTIFC